MDDGPVRWLLTRPPAVYLGKISYGLYMFHTFAIFTKKALLPYFPSVSMVPGFLLALVTTIIAAMLSWHLFEGPINSLKSRFPYPRSPADAGPQDKA